MVSHISSTKSTKWNIIFLIYAELTENEQLKANNEERESILQLVDKLKDDVKSIPFFTNYNVILISNEVTLKNNEKVDDLTYIYLVKPDEKDKTKNVLSLECDPIRIQNLIEKGSELQKVFSKVDKLFHADKHVLVTWDHGSAFGIFKKIKRTEQEFSTEEKLLNKFFIIKNGSNIQTNKSDNEEEQFALVQNKGYSIRHERIALLQGSQKRNTEEIVDILTVDELANAIINGFETKKVEVLIMFNCYMQNFHTCYALKDCVDYLVAPEGIISEPGYDYASVASIIRNKKEDADISAAIAQTAIQTMKSKFEKEDKLEKFQEHAMFAISLKGFKEKVIAPFNKFVEDVTNEIKSSVEVKLDIRLSRRSCYELDLPLHYSMVDFVNMLIRLSQKTKINGIEEIKDYFKDVYTESSDNTIIIRSEVGNNIYTEPGDSWEKNSGTKPTGATIYFPMSKIGNSTPTAIYFAAPNSPFLTSLLKNTQWPILINSLY